MSERKTAAAVGGLYILGTDSGVASVILAGLGFGDPDPFTGIAALGFRAPGFVPGVVTGKGGAA